jgi:putative ABC transport system permease protein
LRSIKRQKLYAAINVLGLSVGVAGCILVFLFIRFEGSFDRFHEKGNRIFRVLEKEKRPDGELFVSGFQPLPAGPALVAEFSEVESMTRCLTSEGTAQHRDQVFTEDFLFVDSRFLDMFSFPLIKGNPTEALDIPNGVVITEAMADKYFGGAPPLGEVLHLTFWLYSGDFVVTGVAADPPDNSSLRFDFLLPIQHFPDYERKITQWGVRNGSLFVLLGAPEQAPVLESKLNPFIQKYYGGMIQNWRDRGQLSEEVDAYRLAFQPFHSIHLDTSVSMSPEKVSNPLYSTILMGIAVLVLTVACINFVNLAVARSASRAKEVGMRKVLGAQRLHLVQQFIGEALLLCALALGLGVGLAHLALPAFSRLAGRNLVLPLFPDASLFFVLTGLVLVVGILAGSYPALYMSRFQPTSVLRGKLHADSRKIFSHGLVVCQFGLSIFLIICALSMNSQHSYLLKKALGYTPEHVIVLPLHAQPHQGQARFDRLKNRLRSHPDFIQVAATANTFGRGWDLNGFEHNGIQRQAYVYRADHEYLSTLGIELMVGRNFNPESGTDAREAVIVNQALVREFGWEEPVVGKRLSGWNERRVPGGPLVIGVMRDYHFLSLKHEIAPAFLVMDPEYPISYALIRFRTGDLPGTLGLLRRTWKEIAPNAPFTYSFLDDDLGRQYTEEMRWGRIVRHASALAVFLAGLGIYGLAVHTMFRRTKEIGIRKILGASYAGILSLLTKSFASLVLLSNAIAWPVAWLVMDRWLDNFAYHIELNPLTFVGAGALALTVSLLTTGVQALKTALSNPVDSLRYE